MNSNKHCKDWADIAEGTLQTKINCFDRGSQRFLIVALFCLLTVLAHKALAQSTNTWTGNAGVPNWSNAGNWSAGALANGSDVFFSAASPEGGTFAVGGGTPNTEVDSSFTINALWSAPTNAWQDLEIPTNVTLTIDGSIPNTSLVSLGTDYYAMWIGQTVNQNMYYTIQGQGTLAVNSPAAVVAVRNSYNAYISVYPTLDMSALSTFTANIVGISVGGDGTTDASFNGRPTGILYLAQTNIISSANTLLTRPSALSGLLLAIGESIVDTGDTSYVYLGNSNAFMGEVGIAVGYRRGQGSLSFNPSSVNGYALFRGAGGVGSQSYWGIGDNNTGNTGFTSTGIADFTGGTVDAEVQTIYVGRSGSSTTSGADGTGTLLIGNGTMAAGSLYIGVQKTANNAGWGKGTVTTSGGASVTNLIVTNNITLGQTVSGGGVASTSGTLTINSCVEVGGSVLAGGAPSTAVTLNGGSLTVGGVLGTSTLAINNLALNSGVLTLSLGTSGNPVTPVCNASNLTVGSVTLNLTGVGITPGTIPVIQYYASGSFSGIAYGSLPPGVFGYFSNSPNTIYVVVTNVDEPKWNGTVNGNWDTTTLNWIGATSGEAITYQQAAAPADSVLFDDTARGTTTIALTTNLTPTSITINNSVLTYAFGGPGEISGSTGLTKEGSAMLILTNTGTNSFSGPVTINGGYVKLGGNGNCLPMSATVTLSDTNDVTLDLGGENQLLGSLQGGGTNGGSVILGGATLELSGNGGEFDGVISGAGSLVKTNGGTQILGGANLYSGGTVVDGGTLVVVNGSGSGIGTGNLLISGGTFQIGNAGSGGSIPSTTVVSNNGTLAIDLANDLVFGNLVTGSGGLTKLNVNTLTLPSTNSYTGPTTISDGALSISTPGALGTPSGTLSISSTDLGRVELSGGIGLPNPIVLSSKSGSFGAPPHIENLSGTNSVTGPISGAGGGTDWSFQSDTGALIITGSFTNTATSVSQDVDLRGPAFGAFYGNIAGGASPAYVVALNKLDSGTWILGGTNTYTGATTVEAGTLVVNGQILNSAGVNVSDSTLAGSGLITGPVTAGFASTIAPGDGGYATLTISNNLTLGFDTTCIFDLSPTVSDQIRGLQTVNYNGTLQIDGTNFVANEVFQLFDATNYNGSFGTINLPSLPSPLNWDTSYLAVDGTLRITGGPAVTAFGFDSSGNFNLAGTGTDGFAYQIYATTNLSLPLSSWTLVSSGTLAGGFTFSDTNAASFPHRFYEVVTPQGP